MKRGSGTSLLVVSMIAMLAVLMGDSQAGQRGQGDPAFIARTETAPVIDGVREALWDAAPAYTMENVVIGTIDGPDDLSGVWRGLWDDNYLYFFLDVKDETLINDSEDNNPWKDDTVEFFMDMDNSNGSSYDGVNDWELIFRWDDEVLHPGANSVKNVEGIEWSFVATTEADGYTFEVRMPWTTLNVVPVQGNFMGLDPHLTDDDDGGERDSKITWFGDTDNAWRDPRVMGLAQFSDETGTLVPTPTPTPPPSAASQKWDMLD